MGSVAHAREALPTTAWSLLRALRGSEGSGSMAEYDPIYARQVFPEDSGGVTQLAVTPFGDRLAAGGGSESEVVLLFTTGLREESRTVSPALPNDLQFLPGTGASLLIATADGLRQQATTSATGSSFGDHASAKAICYSPDAKSIAVGALNRLQVIDAADGRVRWTLDLPGLAPTVLAFDPGGTLLAAADPTENAVVLYDPATGRVINTLGARSRGKRIDTLAWTPDGARLIFAGEGHPPEIWNVDTGASEGLAVRSRPVCDALALSPNGLILATGYHGPVILWDLRTGRNLGRLLGPTDSIVELTFTPDGMLIIAGSADGQVFVWGVPRLGD